MHQPVGRVGHEPEELRGQDRVQPRQADEPAKLALGQPRRRAAPLGMWVEQRCTQDQGGAW